MRASPLPSATRAAYRLPRWMAEAKSTARRSHQPSGLEAIPATESQAVAAGPHAADEHEDRRDDAHDRRQPEGQAEPVDQRGQQDADEDSDHAGGIPRTAVLQSPASASPSRPCPSATAAAISTTVRLRERAWPRSRSNASRSLTLWRSMMMPLARSISARRSSALSSWTI